MNPKCEGVLERFFILNYDRWPRLKTINIQLKLIQNLDGRDMVPDSVIDACFLILQTGICGAVRAVADPSALNEKPKR